MLQVLVGKLELLVMLWKVMGLLLEVSVRCLELQVAAVDLAEFDVEGLDLLLQVLVVGRELFVIAL